MFRVEYTSLANSAIVDGLSSLPATKRWLS